MAFSTISRGARYHQCKRYSSSKARFKKRSKRITKSKKKLIASRKVLTTINCNIDWTLSSNILTCQGRRIPHVAANGTSSLQPSRTAEFSRLSCRNRLNWWQLRSLRRESRTCPQINLWVGWRHLGFNNKCRKGRLSRTRSSNGNPIMRRIWSIIIRKLLSSTTTRHSNSNVTMVYVWSILKWRCRRNEVSNQRANKTRRMITKLNNRSLYRMITKHPLVRIWNTSKRSIIASLRSSPAKLRAKPSNLKAKPC